MTDVRLTATNPEDSSVVPVACNAKGELKLEEPIAFDGNLDGDLTVNGSAEFAGQVKSSRSATQEARLNPNGSLTLVADEEGTSSLINVANKGSELFAVKANGSSTFAGTVQAGGSTFGDSPQPGVVLNDEGAVVVARGASSVFIGKNTTDGSVTSEITHDGSATFASNVESGFVGGTSVGVQLVSTGFLNIREDSSAGDCFAIYKGSPVEANKKVGFKSNGSAAFAGGKAGFTAEGYLWCTTRRGDTVILDATSNGLATWASYTPPTRRDLIKEKVAEWSEKDTNDPDFGVSPEDNTET